MTDWISFEASIVTMSWGDSAYTVLPLPDDVTEALAAQSAKRVEVELNDHPFNMALTKALALSQVFVYTGKAVLRQAGIAPGETLDVRLRKADPSAVDVPADVTHALTQAGVLSQWTALTPGKQRGALYQVTSAKRAETRTKRITKLIAELRGAAEP